MQKRKQKKNNKIQINIALNYGSREEIVNSIRILNKKSLKINQKNISKFLYTKDQEYIYIFHLQLKCMNSQDIKFELILLINIFAYIFYKDVK